MTGPVALTLAAVMTGDASTLNLTPDGNTPNAVRAMRSLVLIGAVIRIASWLSKWNEPVGIYDAWYYSDQAYQLTHGRLFREVLVDLPSADHGPLTSILMAPVSWGDDFVRWQRLVTVICGITTVWLLGQIGRRLGGDRLGVIATGIAAFSPILWISDGLVMSESVGMLAVSTVMWFALAAVEDGGRRSTVVLGIALGLAALARSELALLIPAVVLWLAVARWRRREGGLRTIARGALPALIAALVVLGPWVGFNLARFERPVFLTTNEAGTLLGANCDDSYSAIGDGAGGWSVFCIFEDPEYYYGEEPSVRAARQRSLAADYVREHLDEVPRVIAARVLRSLDLYGLRDLVRGDVGEGRTRWVAWAAVGTFWLTAPAALFGARRLRRRDRWLLLLPIALVLFTTVVFYGGHRIRSSAEPSLVLLAAAGIAQLKGGRFRTREVKTAVST